MSEYINKEDLTKVFLNGINSFLGFYTAEQVIENINSVPTVDIEKGGKNQELVNYFKRVRF